MRNLAALYLQKRPTVYTACPGLPRPNRAKRIRFSLPRCRRQRKPHWLGFGISAKL